MNATDEWFAEVNAARKDMERRWLPDEAARKVAAAMLAAAPGAEAVIVPMIQPGKQRGVWTEGQEVVTVHAYLVAGGGLGDYATARATAVRLAELALAELAAKRRGAAVEPGRPVDLDGTVGFAVIEADGEAVVFEWA